MKLPKGFDFTPLGRILDLVDLAKLPKPEPLIEGWLELRTTALVVGETGTNKTFALLGWACSVATGTPWLDHQIGVDPAPVIYVVGEGGFGLRSRIAAWEEDTGVKMPRGSVVTVLLPEAGLTSDDFWEALRFLAVSLEARLVILDTFSSLASAADETTDAAGVLRQMADAAVDIDGAVVLAHHTGWAALDRARGASQFESNADSVVVFKKLDAKRDTDAEADNGPVEVLRKKNKDGPAGARLYLRRRYVGGSCVLESVAAPPGKTASGSGGRAEVLRKRLREVLADADPFTLTRTQVVDAVGGTKDRVRTALDGLIGDGQILEESHPRPEGEHTRTRALLAWNTADRVVVPLRQPRRGVGVVDPTTPVGSGVVGVVGVQDE